MKTSKIAVLTGGGDCAGLNSALKWVVKTAMDTRLVNERGICYEVLGIIHSIWTPVPESKTPLMKNTSALFRAAERSTNC